MFDLFKEHEEKNPGIFWFIVIFIGLYVLWLVSGGPERSVKYKNDKFEQAPAPLDGGKTYDEPLFKS